MFVLVHDDTGRSTWMPLPPSAIPFPLDVPKPLPWTVSDDPLLTQLPDGVKPLTVGVATTNFGAYVGLMVVAAAWTADCARVSASSSSVLVGRHMFHHIVTGP